MYIVNVRHEAEHSIKKIMKERERERVRTEAKRNNNNQPSLLLESEHINKRNISIYISPKMTEKPIFKTSQTWYRKSSHTFATHSTQVLEYKQQCDAKMCISDLVVDINDRMRCCANNKVGLCPACQLSNIYFLFSRSNSLVIMNDNQHLDNVPIPVILATITKNGTSNKCVYIIVVECLLKKTFF